MGGRAFVCAANYRVLPSPCQQGSEICRRRVAPSGRSNRLVAWYDAALGFEVLIHMKRRLSIATIVFACALAACWRRRRRRASRRRPRWAASPSTAFRTACGCCLSGPGGPEDHGQRDVPRRLAARRLRRDRHGAPAGAPEFHRDDERPQDQGRARRRTARAGTARRRTTARTTTRPSPRPTTT